MTSPSPVPAMESPPPALDPVPDPSPLPPAAVEEVEEEERPSPPLVPNAMYRVFGGMCPAGDDVLAAAYVGIHALLYVVHTVRFHSLWAAPERAQFWGPIEIVVVCACVAANALIIGLFIRRYMCVDGIRELDPSRQQQPAAAAAASELLPPPPPEMDMC